MKCVCVGEGGGGAKLLPSKDREIPINVMVFSFSS